MAETCPPRPASARGRAQAWLLSTIWLVFLIQPAMTVPDQRPAILAGAGLAGFVLLFALLLYSAWQPRARLVRLQPAGLALIAALGVTLAAGYGWPQMLLYVAAVGAAVVPMPWQAGGWLAGSVVAMLAVGTFLGMPLPDLAALALVIVLIAVLNLTMRRMGELIDHLRRTQAELAETAVANERLRFSRDLHDLLGHTLSLIVVKAEVIRRSAEREPATVAREASDVERIGRQALAEVREAVTGYRERAFSAELDAARAALADAGLRVNVRISGTPLPPAADGLLGWAVREAATNVVRHSEARQCEIEVRRVNGHATLEVRDDGVGGAGPAGPGRGLTGLHERLAEAGGRLEAGGAEGGGWRLAATVPVSSPATP